MFQMKLFYLINLGRISYWIGIFLLCLQFLAFSQEVTTAEKNPTKVFSVEDQGQVLSLTTGESFMLVLPNPGSGGYLVQDPEFDPQILILQKMEKKPPSDPNRAGDFGSFEWTFVAKKRGISSLIVRAFRPWEKDKAPTVIFEAIVQVSRRSPQ